MKIFNLKTIRLYIFFLLCGCVIQLIGCGQSGPLYLPGQPPPIKVCPPDLQDSEGYTKEEREEADLPEKAVELQPEQNEDELLL